MTATTRHPAPTPTCAGAAGTGSRPQGILARKGIAQALGALFWALIVVLISFWV